MHMHAASSTPNMEQSIPYFWTQPRYIKPVGESGQADDKSIAWGHSASFRLSFVIFVITGF